MCKKTETRTRHVLRAGGRYDRFESCVVPTEESLERARLERVKRLACQRLGIAEGMPTSAVIHLLLEKVTA